jgi:hypothetical protein
MPFPKKYTDAEIWKLHEEFSGQDKDLKTFCEERKLNYTTIRARFERLERRLAKGLPPIQYRASRSPSGKELAEEEVATTVQQEIAAEAKTTAEEKIVLGKILDKDIIEPLYREGLLTPSELKDKLATAEKIRELIRKGKDYEKLTEEYEEAVEALNFYRSRTDPIVRIEQGMEMLSNFLEMAMLMKLFGVDIVRSEVGEYYAGLIEDYLLGRPVKSFKSE